MLILFLTLLELLFKFVNEYVVVEQGIEGGHTLMMLVSVTSTASLVPRLNDSYPKLSFISAIVMVSLCLYDSIQTAYSQHSGERIGLSRTIHEGP